MGEGINPHRYCIFIVAIGFGVMPKSSFSSRLLFIHLALSVDGHVLRVGVIARLPQHHQLQAVLFLLRRQRDAIGPFSQLYGGHQTLINLRRHAANHVINIHNRALSKE